MQPVSKTMQGHFHFTFFLNLLWQYEEMDYKLMRFVECTNLFFALFCESVA
jgi:hypothetical protein